MDNRAFQRALDCLAHPLTLMAIAMLALNALVLQPRWPSWWTGKLGDAAWLFFVPLLAALAFSRLVPRRWGRQETVVVIAALGVTGLGFALAKACPAVNEFVARLFLDLTGRPAKLALDPTDLLALPALAGPWLLWKKAPRRSAQPLLRGLAVLLAVAVTAADAAAPQSKGIICLQEKDGVLVAVEERWEAEGDRFGPPQDNLHWISHRSTDGGLSWQKVEGKQQDNPCTGGAAIVWPIQDRRHRLEYAFVAGEGVYARRYDGEEAWYMSLALPPGVAVTGALVHEPTGNVVLALGPDQMMVKPPDQPWEQRFPIPQTALLGKSIIRPTQPTRPPTATARPSRPTLTPTATIEPARHLQGFVPSPTAEELARWRADSTLPETGLLGIASAVYALTYR